MKFDDSWMIGLVVVAITLFVGMQVVSAATSPEMHEYVNQSEEWCENHNGELTNAMVVGSHGGLHCTLPNGTSVHMSEVIDRGETA